MERSGLFLVGLDTKRDWYRYHQLFGEILRYLLRRREDIKFITGRGRYVDDISFPDLLYLSFVRSPHAHAAYAPNWPSRGALSPTACPADRRGPVSALFVLAIT